MESKPKKHGGKRPGAGRPSAGPSKRHSVRLTQEEEEQLKQLGDGTITNGIRQALQRGKDKSK